MPERHLAIVLHDVAPATWPAYRPFVAAVDALAATLGPIPLTWLVVPDFHGRGRFDGDPAFVDRLQRRLERGDELALHGYYHRDDAPPPRTPGEWWMRRLYTREGEFQAIDDATVDERLDGGAALFADQGWPPPGFVAPAWLMNAATRRALTRRDFLYTSCRKRLYRLPEFTPLPAPGLVWSARSAWRRGLSLGVCTLQAHHHRQAGLLRLGIHPVDLGHPGLFDRWLRIVVTQIRAGRQPITKRQWLGRQARGATPP
ncbi:DUF2334 domain-containing protein [Modicisalibacter coralii]|uniref:DUF2334 domain-containing protein n=1 Tax=Modicisalibacter coralii TaxID=2304602 RepID=UPI00100A5452|nr:polysaccharide deacetylase family protein [Halomonas coralii]